ncbi:iduronate 2-sulfatase [Phlebotomus argentipes]|uniref:iduronate 2-sulfatase n=1 Tax=Phlebotomus argentipes TaxID=94469 RepID=UPI002893219C|nr:iduronate 2-sulfatase [Phlebotomus argentipes]
MIRLLLLSVLCSAASAKYNVVFIVLDDMRPAIASYGDPKALTPHMDSLLKEGFYFNRAYAQQAVCAPSRNSMLTSRRPDTLHLYDFYSYWREFAGNYTTLPQYLKSHGYFTASVGKVFHPGVTSNFTDDYPYSWSTEAYHPPTEEFMHAPVCEDAETGKLVQNLLCPVDVTSQPGHSLPDIESVEKAVDILNNVSEPFFLAVGLHKPHIPFRIPREYLDFHPLWKFYHPDTSYKPYDLPNVAWNPFVDVRGRHDVKKLNVSFPFGPLPKDFRAQIRQYYYASVTYVDALIGKLLKAIEKDNTIVILTGDHGWSLGEHGEWAKYSNFEVALRVPLIIRAPGMQPKTKNRIDQPVELLDIFPTIVDLLELPQVPKCSSKSQDLCTEGESLVPYLRNRGKRNVRKMAFSQYPRPGDYPSEKPNSDKPRLEEIKIMGYSVRNHRFRYTLWVSFDPKNFTRNWDEIHGEELYDHSLDSGENINLASREPLSAIKAHFRRILKEKFSEA